VKPVDRLYLQAGRVIDARVVGTGTELTWRRQGLAKPPLGASQSPAYEGTKKGTLFPAALRTNSFFS
jgi:hypothetical protein